MKLATLALCSLLLIGLSCASVTVNNAVQTEDFKTGAFVVEFEFDQINLKETVRAELMRQGFSVADSRENARFLWTGSFSASFDLVHQRFDWAQFKVVDLATNKTASQMQVGQGGLESVEGIIKSMVTRIGGVRPPPSRSSD